MLISPCVYFRSKSHEWRIPKHGRTGSCHMHVHFPIPTPTPHPTLTLTTTMQQPTKSTSITPNEIRRRINDLDDQVRQGLERGTIRQVMRSIGPLFVSPFFLFLLLLSSPSRTPYLPIRGEPERNKRPFHGTCSSIPFFGSGTCPNDEGTPILSICNWRPWRPLTRPTPPSPLSPDLDPLVPNNLRPPRCPTPPPPIGVTSTPHLPHSPPPPPLNNIALALLDMVGKLLRW